MEPFIQLGSWINGSGDFAAGHRDLHVGYANPAGPAEVMLRERNGSKEMEHSILLQAGGTRK